MDRASFESDNNPARQCWPPELEHDDRHRNNARQADKVMFSAHNEYTPVTQKPDRCKHVIRNT